MRFVHAIGHALEVAGGMTWQILWSLVLGFTLSAIVQALVRRGTVERLLGNDSPKTLGVATGFGHREFFVLLRGRCAGTGPVPNGGQFPPRPWCSRSPRPTW